MIDRLYIRYEDSAGEVTERLISAIEPDGHGKITAHCHKYGETRTFAVARVLLAIDQDTGEVLHDLAARFGSAPARLPIHRERTERPFESSMARRKREKAELWSRFRFGAIEDDYRRRFFALFDNRCFKCGAQPPLVIDHHLPHAAGGHLVPGNLVALCRRCNGIKLERHPNEFYSPQELARLVPILEAEHALFDFAFNRDAWDADPEGYLVAIGLPPEEADALLNDPTHPRHIPLRSSLEDVTVTFRLDISAYLKDLP